MSDAWSTRGQAVLTKMYTCVLPIYSQNSGAFGVFIVGGAHFDTPHVGLFC